MTLILAIRESVFSNRRSGSGIREYESPAPVASFRNGCNPQAHHHILIISYPNQIRNSGHTSRSHVNLEGRSRSSRRGGLGA
jgi:hypothetical protein